MKKYINRIIESEVVKLAENFPVVMITGPRQVGKSTLLDYIAKQLDKNIARVTLDNIQERTLATLNPQLF